jgi:hypothetical protein
VKKFHVEVHNTLVEGEAPSSTSVHSGLTSVHSGLTSVHSGLTSVHSGLTSVHSGLRNLLPTLALNVLSVSYGVYNG